MAEPNRFVKLEWGPQLVGPRHCRKGSVVEVSETRAKAMVESKAATFHDGPESDEGEDDPKTPAELAAEAEAASKKGKGK